jgi:hypothetical protein
MKYDPRATYNVNVYRRNGKVHVIGCYQGDAHAAANPTHYRQILGRHIDAHKEPCRICLRQSIA